MLDLKQLRACSVTAHYAGCYGAGLAQNDSGPAKSRFTSKATPAPFGLKAGELSSPARGCFDKKQPYKRVYLFAGLRISRGSAGFIKNSPDW